MDTPAPSLFDHLPPPEPPPKAPGLLDQFVGLLTRPAALFEDLAKTPAWVAAYLLSAGAILVFLLTWVHRVDWFTFLAEQREKQGLPPQAIPESALGFIKGLATLQMAVIAFGFMLLLGLVLWGLAHWKSESREPVRFSHAMSALAVPTLVKLPGAVLGTLALATRHVERTPEWYVPTNLGFYLEAANPRVQALFHHLDLLGLASGILAYLALRRTLRLPTWLAVASVIAYNAVFTLLPILAAK